MFILLVLKLILELNEYIELLDKRFSEKNHREAGLVAKKIRKLGSPSTSEPPTDSPTWAIEKDGKIKFTLHLLTNILYS